MNRSSNEIKVEKMGLASLADLCAEKIWKSMSWVGYDGAVPVVKAFTSGHRVENDSMVEDQECKRHERRPRQCHMLEAQMGFSQQRRNVGYTYGKTGWAKRRLDTIMESGSSQENRRDPLAIKDDSPDLISDEERWRYSSHKGKRR